MLYTIHGKLTIVSDTFAVVECGGVGFKILTNTKTLARLPAIQTDIRFFCFPYIREDNISLYGFVEEETLKLFELLNNVQGVGPKMALNLLDIDSVPRLMAAIVERRADMLTRASGVGKKTAERIILELQTRIKLAGAPTLTKAMDVDYEIEEVLAGLGYARSEIRNVLHSLPKQEDASVETRLKETLKELGRRR